MVQIEILSMFFCLPLLFLNVFFMKIVWRRKEIPWERVKCRRNVHFSRFKNRLCSASFFSVNVNTYLLWDSPTTFHSTIFHIGRCWGYCHGVFCCIYTAFNQIEIIFFTHERFSHSLEVAIKIDIRAHVMKRLGGRNGKECRLWKKI